jgi:iron complex transport system ATP-binding protein
MMIKLQINGLTFSYNSVPILNDVCMQVAPAKLLSIVGPNGTGKSTLLKCIDRVLTPQRGSILLDRKDVMKMDRMEIAKQVGYVQQNVKRSFPTTVFDTVNMGRRPHQGSHTSYEDQEIVWEILELLDIDQFALKYFNELSGGQQQRVLIARALAQEASVLLLDEPTSNLDIKRQLEVMDIIQDLVRRKRITAIVAIHDLNLASRYSDRMIMMKDGKIIVTGDPSEVLTAENIEAIYGVKAAIKTQSDAPYIIPLKPIKTNKANGRNDISFDRRKKKGSSIGRLSDNLYERIGQMKILK